MVAVEECGAKVVVEVEDQDTLKVLYVPLLLVLMVVMVTVVQPLLHQKTQVHTTLLVLQ